MRGRSRRPAARRASRWRSPLNRCRRSATVDTATAAAGKDLDGWRRALPRGRVQDDRSRSSRSDRAGRRGRARRRVVPRGRPRARKGGRAELPGEHRDRTAADRGDGSGERTQRRGRVSSRLCIDREPRQSRSGDRGSSLAALPACERGGQQARRIRFDHERRRCRLGYARRGGRGLRPDAVHPDVQRQLLRPLRPVPGPRQLGGADHHRRAADQRPPVDGLRGQTHAGEFGRNDPRLASRPTRSRARSRRPHTSSRRARASLRGRRPRSPAATPEHAAASPSSPTTPAVARVSP